jgi:hypothetical protein
MLKSPLSLEIQRVRFIRNMDRHLFEFKENGSCFDFRLKKTAGRLPRTAIPYARTSRQRW